MRFLIVSLLLLTIQFQAISQSAEWTKADRNVLFDEYNSFLVQYKNLSAEQRESLSLCCLDETTKGYTKAQYNAKIEIELKRIREATIIQCAKNMGIELKKGEPEVVKPDVPAQTTAVWTKEDKSKLAKSAYDFIDLDFISNEDKERLVLCYIEDVTTNLTKAEYELLIEIELRQLKTTTILKCAKKLGISLDAPVKVEVKQEKSNRDKLVGTWKTDQHYVIQLKDDGTFVKNFTTYFKTRLKKGDVDSYISNNSTNGNWFIDNSGIVTFNETVQLEWYFDRRRGRETYYYNYVLQSTWLIEELNDKTFKIKYLGGSTCCTMNAGSYTDITYPKQILGNKQ